MCRVDLVSDVLADTPEAQGRLLIDLINEPDGYSLTWEVRICCAAHCRSARHPAGLVRGNLCVVVHDDPRQRD